MNVEQRLHECLVFVILLKELLRKATFLCRKIQKFTIIEFTTELLSQHLGYNSPTTAYLSAHVYDYLLVHIFLFMLVVMPFCTIEVRQPQPLRAVVPF